MKSKLNSIKYILFVFIISLLSNSVIAQLASFAPPYAAGIGPSFFPRPVSSSASGAVTYDYEWVGDSDGDATCTSTSGNVYGYTAESWSIGGTYLTNRAKAAAALHSASSYCGPMNVNNQTIATVTYDALAGSYTGGSSGDFSFVVGSLTRNAQVYATHTVAMSGAWGSYDVWVATCPNGSSYHKAPPGWCDCGGSVWPYRTYADGCSTYVRVEVRLAQNASPPSFPNPGTSGDASVSYAYDLPVVTIEAVDDTIAEGGGNIKYRVSRTGPTTLALPVNISISGTATAPPSAGYDYTINGSSSAFSSITIPASSSSVNILLAARTDGITEGTETTIFTITSSSAYTIGSPSSATAFIHD